MPLPCRVCFWSSLAAFCGATTVSAAPPQTMLFKNNLTPGLLTRHQFTRTIRRQTPRDASVQTLTYEQQSTLLQAIVDEPKPGRATLYQMTVDHPARVVDLLRDGKTVDPLPPPAHFNLSLGSTRLYSETLTPRDAPAQTPLADPPQQIALTTLLDFAHWPAKPVEAGHRWQRPIRFDGFEGTQTSEFVDLVDVQGQVAARLTLLVQGKFVGPLEKEYEFDHAKAIIHWSRQDRTLLKLEGQADYRRRRGGDQEICRLTLNAGLIECRTLPAEQLAPISQQLTLFAQALQQKREGRTREASRLCASFRQKWPDSLWLPAVRELEKQSSPRADEAKHLNTKQLKALLVKSVIAWEAARQTKEFDLAERTQELLAQLAIDHRGKLEKLAKDKDDLVRSHAVFALAFGDKPEDLRRVQKAARDPSVKVRSMATAGLAARHSPDTPVDLLLSLLDDPEPGVRRRACQAVAACLSPENLSIVKIIDTLNHLMVYDKLDVVRLEAVRAIAVLGAPADVPKLEKALTYELNHENREELEKAIESLKRKA